MVDKHIVLFESSDSDSDMDDFLLLKVLNPYRNEKRANCMESFI